MNIAQATLDSDEIKIAKDDITSGKMKRLLVMRLLKNGMKKLRKRYRETRLLAVVRRKNLMSLQQIGPDIRNLINEKQAFINNNPDKVKAYEDKVKALSDAQKALSDKGNSKENSSNSLDSTKKELGSRID